MRGMSRHLRLPALVASLLALPSLVLPSAAGNAPWSKVKLTAETHLGTLELTATTKGAREHRTLDQLTIVVDGVRIVLPRKADIHVPQPRLEALEIEHTASYSCIEGDCPDVRQWPVTIVIPFGERTHLPTSEARDVRAAEECAHARLHIGFTRLGIDTIAIWKCDAAGDDLDGQVLYPFPGDDRTDR
jgi:hypothetical protein